MSRRRRAGPAPSPGCPAGRGRPRDPPPGCRGSACRSRSTAGPGAATARAAQVASNETASAFARRAVARTARPGITLPSHSTTGMPERRGGQQDRYRHVAAGREDRGRTLAARIAAACGTDSGQAQRVEHGVDVRSDRCAASGGQGAGAGCPRAGTMAGLEATVAAQPAKLSDVRSSAQRPGDGQRRVDVSARSPARDQQSHRRSRSPSRWSRARSRAGSRPPRS